MSGKSTREHSADIAHYSVKRARRSLRWRNRLSGAPFRSRRI